MEVVSTQRNTASFFAKNSDSFFNSLFREKEIFSQSEIVLELGQINMY